MPDTFQTFRDPLLSLYQSAVDQIAKRLDANPTNKARGARLTLPRSAASTLPGIAAEIAQRAFDQERGVETSQSQSASIARELTNTGIARVCAELSFRYLNALARGDSKALSELKHEFVAGTCDPAWLNTLIEYHLYFESDGKRKPIPYIRASDDGPKTIEIKTGARVAVAGDWGTGAQPAIDVLKTIADHNPDVFVHLGDIYYSGTSDECQTNFVDPIDLVLRKGTLTPDVFTLSGNHDMYCGGVGFYELIKRLNAPPSIQPASFFCLRSADEKWQILAMDTGLHDDSPVSVADAVTFLEDDELAWHCDRIREFPGRTILLSHHQLFSAFSPIGAADTSGKRSALNPHLLKAFQKISASGNIAAWFWGHEHTLGIYKPFAGLKRGRCVGHGAVPVSLIDKIYDTLPDLEEPPEIIEATKLGATGGVYTHGYALLEFEGDVCRAEYFEQNNEGRSRVYVETIS